MVAGGFFVVVVGDFLVVVGGFLVVVGGFLVVVLSVVLNVVIFSASLLVMGVVLISCNLVFPIVILVISGNICDVYFVEIEFNGLVVYRLISCVVSTVGGGFLVVAELLWVVCMVEILGLGLIGCVDIVFAVIVVSFMVLYVAFVVGGSVFVTTNGRIDDIFMLDDLYSVVGLKVLKPFLFTVISGPFSLLTVDENTGFGLLVGLGL